MSDPIIQVKNLSKTFEIPHEKKDTIKSRFLNPFSRPKKSEFHALKDVNFDIKKGEIVGFIGKNGSGKSTLLKIITGIYAASQGSVKVEGSVIPFLELGIGFNSELTGRENVFLNGAILGMKTSYLRAKFDEIVDFAEIGEFIDLPIKNYSSGMRVRLAFAIAVQAKADIYLLDEVLAVGDSQFQAKSINKMNELLLNGATVLFVSHSINDVKNFCSRVIFLEKGKVEFDGEVLDGIKQYQLSLMNKKEKEMLFKLERENRLNFSALLEKTTNLDEIKESVSQRLEYGDGRAELIHCELKDTNDNVVRKLDRGQDFIMEAEYEIQSKIDNPAVGISFCTGIDKPIWIIRTATDENAIPSLNRGDRVKVQFKCKNTLLPGNYSLRLNLSDPVIKGQGKGTHCSMVQEYMIVDVVDSKLAPGQYPNYAGNVDSLYQVDFQCITK